MSLFFQANRLPATNFCQGFNRNGWPENSPVECFSSWMNEIVRSNSASSQYRASSSGGVAVVPIPDDGRVLELPDDDLPGEDLVTILF